MRWHITSNQFVPFTWFFSLGRDLLCMTPGVIARICLWILALPWSSYIGVCFLNTTGSSSRLFHTSGACDMSHIVGDRLHKNLFLNTDKKKQQYRSKEVWILKYYFRTVAPIQLQSFFPPAWLQCWCILGTNVVLDVILCLHFPRGPSVKKNRWCICTHI